MTDYNFKELELKYKEYWKDLKLYDTGNDPDKPKFYCLDFFPYPSGSGLSVGHCRNYIPSDIISRKLRMDGYNVLHPMGWDSFGQPAEEYAIKVGKHPLITTRENAKTYKKQMELIEASYDWEREIFSCDPDYYKWTQYFFLLLYKRGLAYQDYSYQWYCPFCKIVLSNEQASNGACWRCEKDVTKVKLKQWFFKITDYADRLLEGLDRIDWPEPIKAMQRNWIGRSEGSRLIFKIDSEDGNKYDLPVFTTRIDTIYGATFCVLAPEHPLARTITTEDNVQAVDKYIKESLRKSDIQRLSTDDKEKTGIFTGSYAINPFSGNKTPVYIADYVLMDYGTGAIMAVPAHDTRDFAFARRYNIPIIQVISPDGKVSDSLDEAYTQEGIMVNSGQFNGLLSGEAISSMNQYAEEKGFGNKEINYKFHDWLISRQRYWGAPIPIIHCKECGSVPVQEEDLPVILPEIESFAPDDSGSSPLSKLDSFINTKCPVCNSDAKREVDTIDGFACSSWYFLRFASPNYSEGPFDPEAVSYWLPVDLYLGGAEHAVMHLLYARFWTKVMYDAKLIDFDEPFKVLKNQGMLLGTDNQKMSKSKGNVITPDEMVEKFGTDALRTYILFMGPFEAEIAWSEEGIAGCSRFLRRIWRLFNDTLARTNTDKPAVDLKEQKEMEYIIHYTIKKVSKDIDNLQFNTAVAAIMEFTNHLNQKQTKAHEYGILWHEALSSLIRILSPIAPFITEELYKKMGNEDSIHKLTWIKWNEKKIVKDIITIAIQVNGKLRDSIEINTDSPQDAVEKLAFESPKIQRHTEGKNIKKIIYVKNKILNIVAV